MRNRPGEGGGAGGVFRGWFRGRGLVAGVLVGVVSGLVQACAVAPEVTRAAVPTVEAPPPPEVTRTASAAVAGGEELFAEGVRRLRSNDLPGARQAWERFLQVDAADPRGAAVRGYLTLLRRAEAKQVARVLVADQGKRYGATAEPGRVAIMPFDNFAYSERLTPKKPFHRAVMALITSDLAQVPGLQLLERERIGALLSELELAGSPLAVKGDSPQLGRMLGAGVVITGMVEDRDADSYADGRYRIVTVATALSPERKLGVQEAEGSRAKFFDVEKEIVFEILEALGIKEIPPGVRRIHTRNWEAYAEFAIGLELLESGDFTAARAALDRALSHDPEFNLARDILEQTPTQELTPQEIITQLSAGR